MRINHNIMAINNYRQLTSNNNQVSKSLEKLSSGQRINRAGDNAAGLAISEKMRGQIRGLDQAGANARDAISLIQTAEGALGETHSLLQRMRELSVQAANDVNATADREAIQNEINQLTEEINRIANNTEFNTQKLLNRGSVGSSPSTLVELSDEEKLVVNLKKWWLKEAEKLVNDSFGLSVSNINMSVEIINDPLSNYAAFVQASYQAAADTVGDSNITGKGSNLALKINLAYSQPPDTLDGGTYPQYVDRVIAHEITHAVMTSTMNFGDLSSWFVEGTAEFVHGGDERLKNSIYLMGGLSLNPADLDTGVSVVANRIAGIRYEDWGAADSHDYSAAYLAVRYLDHQIKAAGGSGIGEVMALLAADPVNPTLTLDQALSGVQGTYGGLGFDSTATWLAAFKANVTDVASMIAETGVQLDFSVTGSQFTPEADTGSVLGSDVTGNLADAETAESIMPETGGVTATEVDQPMTGFNIIWPTFSQSVTPVTVTPAQLGAFSIQIGSSTGQTMVIETGDMRAAALGIEESGTGLNMTTHEAATNAISLFDNAIKLVSAERSRLGAYQNRLEHTVKNLESASENLTSSESRIRDVDMAREMMQFTRTNILSQAAQAMLSQANQQPQGVLQLLA